MVSRLTLDEALAILGHMTVGAVQMQVDPDENSSGYWDGWEDGLLTLREHIETGVRVTCFPIGSCECHPVKQPDSRPEG
jgi:hypothetical protein